ncbi:EndoU domain-containing protein [Amycolatopsis suaedae]|uniref:Bacterial EndoU nuclease domain-containing protein n=1 Tax=Amycolatopsis suaedae TaxID=2510978 RepID=A0A4Q7JF17_9PSEU|nr:EndoU domain-containing protein [Amycolatopsis suaedae]RZQ65094.1 hypothetical protein EWH70_04135 [Amycolatopsis suaedae]
MGGGHAPGKGRRATTEFPVGWTDERILSTVVDVAKNPDERPRRLRNGRWRTAGVRDGVEIVVLIEQNGQVHIAYPVGGTGVVRNPDTARDPAHPTVADLTDGRVSYFAETLLSQLSDRIPPDDLAHYRSLHHSGEWEELVDVLAAHLSAQDVVLTPDELADFTRLMNSYDIPRPGYNFLNDRDNILGLLRPRRLV